MRSTNLFNKVVITALVCELTLVAIYWIDVLTGGHFQMLHSLFDLDSEGNIPAWFSSSQLFCVAITFWSCAFGKRRALKPSKLFFALAGLPIELRIAGLDRDPSWVPAAGRFINFHFE